MADKFHFKIVITLCPFGFLGKPRIENRRSQWQLQTADENTT